MELQEAIRVIGFGWLVAMAGLVALGMLNHTVITHGLLHQKSRQGRADSSPERVQMLLVTLAVTVAYLKLVFEGSATVGLPAVPSGWAALLGASNGIYLGGKAIRIRNRNKPSKS